MLIRYKKSLEKIAMGLLSFMPEEKKDVKKLQETIKEYESNPDWHLYLWKEEDILGAVGLRVEDDINAIIQHVSVNPSYRNCGIGKRMINGVREQYQSKYVVSTTEEIEEFYQKCAEMDEI
ncbi:GNAT family N-acetyltransferase [Virgibacillus xinjiangensis]|uniref:GNAT family N-acetyltransferase n=1 Tax=Virgibacillus xinjiangensis TaxID=393090 RepID=A0ABV7CRC2_9BACI